ncbi:MAG: Tex-like N-terminal domain-containing protein [Bryobacterales bacterium]
MKALTGLPTSAYLKVAEEAKLQLADLLQLVQHLEAGASPAFLARYRPEISARLNEVELRRVESRLREFLDLEDRRIMVLTAIRQQNRMTPELQKKIEETTDRHELEDYYLAFKPKRRTPADEATEQGLEPLARFLWDQQPDNADIEAVAATYVKPDGGVRTPADALAGARQIVARWLGEDPEIRSALRPILIEESEIVVFAGDQPAREEVAQKKSSSLVGMRSKLGRVAWRQMMAIRRGVRERWLQYSIVLPENRAVEHMLGRLIRNAQTTFCLQLGAAACEAFHQYLAPSFTNEAALALDERCDSEGAASFQKNLRKLLLAPAAGPITVIGLETGRRGGWRAAVVGPGGEFLEGAIVHDPDAAHSGERVAAAGSPQATSAGGEGPEAVGAIEADGSPGEQTAQTDSPDEAGETADPAADSVETAQAEAAAESETIAEVEDTLSENAGDPVIDEEPGDEPSEVREAVGTQASIAPAAQETPPSDAEAQNQIVAMVDEPETAPADGALAAADVAEAQRESKPEESAGSTETPAPASDAGVTQPQGQHAPATQPEAQAAEGTPKPGQPGSGPARKRETRSEVRELSLGELISRHKVAAIVIGNGPGVRQVEKFIRGEVRQAGAPDVFWVPIHEAGTWIYATSKSARREFPKADPVMRSAISLGRRLQDPLGELVKVDPKVLGIGQYHHEVDPKRLRNGLHHTMEECTHQVGADLNTAQLEQLSLIPGITERVAKRILDHRTGKGVFRRREQLREVTGLNQRIYEQAVGFLRVYGGDNPLDTTGIHPMHYAVAEKILAAAGVSAAEALEKPEALDNVQLEGLQSNEHPLELLKATIREFRPSIRQPRGSFTPPAPPIPLRPVEELKVGTKVDGVVTNVANFGAFVDIGADQDGLVHVSQLSDKFVEDPQAAVKVGDRVAVYILALEKGGKRISLSMKEPRPVVQRPRPGARRMAAAAGGQRDHDNGGLRRKRKGPERDHTAVQRTFGPDERAKAREQREAEKLSIDQKLAMLKSKFRTKVE